MSLSDLALAELLAEAAGAAIRPWFRRPFLVETKADFSPVTAADKEAEAAIRRLLEQYRPDDGVIGEEYGDDRPDAERVWVLDPIDGTRAFVAGRPLFGTLIGLLLFIVPGIIFALGMQMVFYAVVIEELGPIDALRRSWELTDGNKLNIFVIVLVSGIGALFAACVTCGIGYLLAIPLLSLIQGVMYHSLASEHPDVSDLV